MGEEEQLPVGQREVDQHTEFTADEINMIESHDLTLEQVREHLAASGKKSLETAIGSLRQTHAPEGDDEAK